VCSHPGRSHTQASLALGADSPRPGRPTRPSAPRTRPDLPGGHPFDLYDYRRDLGHTGDGDGAQFKGRGFIRLTGRANYQRYSAALGLGRQLVDRPDLANDPAIAAQLLSSFLKDKERAIKEALLEKHLKLARKLVNGCSHGLERFIEAFNIGDALLP
jgi:predicted chitinase